ncbi:peptide-N4-(N-acetyl-beta-glucosaminyl)asparagine amidase A-like [Iris pallida]|uniref:Peptide-N4-(N-acetyl-beta-glucosaminyl)asparagine amidase A-like n=1 Tax=Iris pallida TaxID=29817 RepID=A0AAX6F7X4_IRIPA|nr:peptide-N4-(N-acetyl-beta-glucosaminyl)asparagine amidase A-like [Iris pallida]
MHPSLFLLLLFPLSCTTFYLPTAAAASSLPESSPLQTMPAISAPFEHLDPTLPPAFTGQSPKCSVLALRHHFAHTLGSPPASTNYTHPKGCPAPWTRIVLELSASASDLQKDRVAAVWIDGAEILRTSTPLPLAPDTYWRVEKDITQYTALLTRLVQTNGTISMMLENSIAALPGIYSVNLTFHFYRGAVAAAHDARSLGYAAHPTIKSLYRDPADLIVPISHEKGYCSSGGFWFRIDNALHVPTAAVTIPRNAYRAVLEIFSSYHEADKSWYTNPLRSSYLQDHAGFSAGAANGGFRQVYATIDGRFVGGHIPFATIYPSSINPYFWSPVTAIGAFDMPSYDINVTPFLGLMLDGLPHKIGLGVRDSQPYWLLTANLHVWVDAWSDSLEGDLVEYIAPELKISRQAGWMSEDGQSEVLAEGLMQFAGWVSSSNGNLTTRVIQKVKFKNQVQVHNRGTFSQVEMVNKEQTTVEVSKERQVLERLQLLREGPLQVQTSSINMNTMGGPRLERTRMYHQLQETVNLNRNQQAATTSTLIDRQDAEGSALMRGGSAEWGSGDTRSIYKYRDERTCYQRTMNTKGGVIVADSTSPSCSSVADI